MHRQVSRMQLSEDALTALHIPILSGGLGFDRCPSLAAAFSAILRGWNLSAAEGRAASIGTVANVRRRYDWISGSAPEPEGWDVSPPKTVMEALCDLHFELIDWFHEAHPDHLFVHCAAAEFPAGLVVFPSPTKAGKSTLTLQLAAAGHRIFGDDVLPLEPERNDGFSLGIAPRVRLPMPREVDEQLAGFLSSRTGQKDAYYHYVDLAEAELAPLGDTARIAGLVLLERQAEGPARLEPVSQGEMLKLIIRRNFSDEVPAPDIFERLHTVTGAVPRFRLAYSDGRAAITLLERAFGASAAARAAE